MDFDYEVDAPQAFHWDREYQHIIGHITKFVIGTSTFTADMTLTNPMITSGTATAKVVGVIQSCKWNGKPGGKLELTFVVSTATRGSLLTLLHQGSSADGNIVDLEKATVSLGFQIYDYDPQAKKFFKAFHTGGTPITGLIETGNSDMAVQAARKEERDARQAYQAAKKGSKKGGGEGGDDDDVNALEAKWETAKANAEAKEREAKEAERRGLVEKTISLTVKSSFEGKPFPASPQVWQVTTTILPPELAAGSDESIHFAVADLQPLVKQWGFAKPTEDS